MKRVGVPWRRLLTEGGVIIVSVYLAIVLEGMSQDRKDEREARTALAQMLGEMKEDRSDLAEIRAEQLAHDRQYVTVDRWLASPASIPGDSMRSTLDTIFGSNRTLYPRRSAWKTMVAAGQLGELDDPELVTRLGNFYESVSVRVVDDGDDYDESLNAIARTSGTEIVNGATGLLITTDARGLAIFRNQLRWVHHGWNLWYLELLGDYQQRLDALIGELEAYLGAHGYRLSD